MGANAVELRKQIADLHCDLDLLKSGWTPNERTLRNAPIIQYWRFALRTNRARKHHLILQGVVTGHPRFPGIQDVSTSPLVALDVKNHWARTAGRFYRLGVPLEEKLRRSGDDRPSQAGIRFF
jgi:hypothetical protein